MSKYDNLKYLKKVSARTNHTCYNCSEIIHYGDIYYIEQIDDKFLHNLHAKKFCSNCFNLYSDKLLQFKHVKSSKRNIIEDKDHIDLF